MPTQNRRCSCSFGTYSLLLVLGRMSGIQRDCHLLGIDILCILLFLNLTIRIARIVQAEFTRGFRTTSRIRKNRKTASLPVILMATTRKKINSSTSFKTLNANNKPHIINFQPIMLHNQQLSPRMYHRSMYDSMRIYGPRRLQLHPKKHLILKLNEFYP